MKKYRTDRHRNPTAFTAGIARQAGLVLGKDYEIGDEFGDGRYRTARLLGDPIELTIRVLDRIGFYTGAGQQRWNYIAMPEFVWDALTCHQRRKVVEFMYGREGGTDLAHLF